MKKFIKSFILAICLIAPAMFCLTACDDAEHEHTFATEWITSTNATCTETGEKYRECSECGYKESQSIPATGHDFGGYIIDETPTTQSTGECHRECARCHKVEKSSISALKSTGLQFTLNEDNNSYTLASIGTCTDTYINVPNTHKGLPVTKIGAFAFKDNATITGINLSNNINQIDVAGFYACTKLASITIPNSVTSIGEAAFKNCSGLTRITILNSAISINGTAFQDCLNLDEVYFEGTIEQWKSISVSSDDTSLTSATKYYYSENIPQVLGEKFWHYNENGVPTTWPEHNAHTYGDTYQHDATNHWKFCSYCGYQDKIAHTFTWDYSNNETHHWHECVCGVHDEAVAHTFKNGICDDCNFKRIELAFKYLEASNSYEVAGIGRITSTEIIIPSTYDDGTHGTLAVTSIGENAFTQNKQITSVTISNTVKSIGVWAFSGCTGLTSINIPDGVTTIESSAFSSCENVKSLTISKSVTKINSWAFCNCNLEIIQVHPDNTVFASPNNCNAVIEIATNTLILGCKTTIIPNNITKIGENAFRSHSGLTNINIPNSVTIIDSAAFCGCSGLTSLKLPSNLSTIGEFAFINCDKLVSMEIPSTVTTIGRNAFVGCHAFEKVFYLGATPEAWNRIDIGMENEYLHEATKYYYRENTPQELGANFWYYDKNEVPAIWPEHNAHTYDDTYQHDATNHWKSCTYCGYLDKSAHTFTGDYSNNETHHWHEHNCICGAHDEEEHTFVDGKCSSCDYIRETEGLQYAYVSADNPYYQVTGIGSAGVKYMRIPATYNDKTHGTLAVTSIGEKAFTNNTNLISVIIPEGVTTLENRSFAGCNNLTNVSLPTTLTTIKECAFGMTNLAKIEIPANVTTIENWTFQFCENLTNIILPNGITKIQQSAFVRCSNLESIIIPTSVVEIGSFAFNSCPKLSKIFYAGTQTSWNSVTIAADSSVNTNQVYYYSENEPVEAGNYWYYDEEELPAIWQSSN